MWTRGSAEKKVFSWAPQLQSWSWPQTITNLVDLNSNWFLWLFYFNRIWVVLMQCVDHKLSMKFQLFSGICTRMSHTGLAKPGLSPRSGNQRRLHLMRALPLKKNPISEAKLQKKWQNYCEVVLITQHLLTGKIFLFTACNFKCNTDMPFQVINQTKIFPRWVHGVKNVGEEKISSL